MKFPQDKCAVKGCLEPPVESSGVMMTLQAVWPDGTVVTDPKALGEFEVPLCAAHKRKVEQTYAPKPGEVSIEPNLRQHGELTYPLCGCGESVIPHFPCDHERADARDPKEPL